MEEDDTAIDMDEEDEDEEVIAVAEEVEPHKGCKYCLGGVAMIYNEVWQEQLIPCKMHILRRSNGWKSGPSSKVPC